MKFQGGRIAFQKWIFRPLILISTGDPPALPGRQ